MTKKHTGFMTKAAPYVLIAAILMLWELASASGLMPAYMLPSPTDVVKAMAMGADAVLVGRLMVWGLLIGGADGVEWMFRLLREEMARSMQLMGVSNWKELDRSCLVALSAMGREMLCRG